MLCQECQKKPATVHLTKIVNNSKIEKHLCQSCARDLEDVNIAFEPAFSFHHLLTGLLGNEGSPPDSGRETPAEGEVQCRNCQLTYPQFCQIGRFGCSRCYEAFDSRLNPLFKRIHGSSIHTGKLPRRVGGAFRIKKQIEELREELQRRVAAEQFEMAAKLRDEIKALEKHLAAERSGPHES
jgi:protein arginine kinase activator